MNGYTPTIPLHKRLQNLADQIPQPVRASVVAGCREENPYDMERALTAYVMCAHPHSTNDYTAVLEHDVPDPTDAEESDAIQDWLSDHWDTIPEVGF